MESVQLLSMLDFVDYKSQRLYTKPEELNGLPKYTVLDYITELPNYVKLLKEKTALWMFVPVGGNGELIDKPNYVNNEHYEAGNEDEFKDYEKAKEKCLFIIENYEVADDVVFINSKQLMISKETGSIHFKNKVYNTVNDLANEPDLKFQLSVASYKKFINRIEE